MIHPVVVILCSHRSDRPLVQLQSGAPLYHAYDAHFFAAVRAYWTGIERQTRNADVIQPHMLNETFYQASPAALKIFEEQPAALALYLNDTTLSHK